MAEAPKDSKTQLAELMYADEEMRPLMDQWAEKNFPGTQARMESAKAVAQTKLEIAKERELDRAERKAWRAEEARERNIAAIKRDPQLRIQDAEIADIEKIMQEGRAGTYEDAAVIYRAKNTVAAPEPSGYAGSIEIAGLHGGGGKDGEWLSSAFRKGGGLQKPDMGFVDNLTKQRVKNILDDFKRDPIGAQARWA